MFWYPCSRSLFIPHLSISLYLSNTIGSLSCSICIRYSHHFYLFSCIHVLVALFLLLLRSAQPNVLLKSNITLYLVLIMLYYITAGTAITLYYLDVFLLRVLFFQRILCTVPHMCLNFVSLLFMSYLVYFVKIIRQDIIILII